jgi:hypothetical protein
LQDDCPFRSWYWPSWQPRHKVLSSLMYDPASQLVLQDDWAFWFWYCPISQSRHVDSLFVLWYWPAPQILHSTVMSINSRPAGHVLQSESSACSVSFDPGSSRYRPIVQSWHSIAAIEDEKWRKNIWSEYYIYTVQYGLQRASECIGFDNGKITYLGSNEQLFESFLLSRWCNSNYPKQLGLSNIDHLGRCCSWYFLLDSILRLGSCDILCWRCHRSTLFHIYQQSTANTN